MTLPNPNRKTEYDLVGVYKEGIGLVNIDSQAPNKVVKEWLSLGEYFDNITRIKPEYTYGESRIDFMFERNDTTCLMEVKGVTLEKDGVCYFPDAPTIRGVKHLNELAGASNKGYECYVAFVIQMEGITKVLPNIDTHKEFAQALTEAKNAGVKVLCLGCSVGEDYLSINRVANS